MSNLPRTVSIIKNLFDILTMVLTSFLALNGVLSKRNVLSYFADSEVVWQAYFIIDVNNNTDNRVSGKYIKIGGQISYETF